MKSSRFSTLLVTLALCTAGAAAQQNGDVNKLTYPAAPTSNQVDDYHGVKVADPYRPLEDPDAAPVRQWIEAENKLTFGYLKQIPAREKVRGRMQEQMHFARYSVTNKSGTHYFNKHTSGLQN